MNVRQPHAALDADSRVLKARKIELLLGLDNNGSRIRMLEVGCGSGGISHYFGTHSSERYEVDAVDVVDSRVFFEGYSFSRVEGTELPFADECFDVVISNHVIEHVGDEVAQLHHLRELRRVLKPAGIGYLAVPNRWMLVEPHYRLAFLSWLPISMRSKYLQRYRGVPYYDCLPLAMKCLERLLHRANFTYENQCVEAMRIVFRIEGVNGLWQKLASLAPNKALKLLCPIFPTLIYRLDA